jgi:hypothetical protein
MSPQNDRWPFLAVRNPFFIARPKNLEHFLFSTNRNLIVLVGALRERAVIIIKRLLVHCKGGVCYSRGQLAVISNSCISVSMKYHTGKVRSTGTVAPRLRNFYIMIVYWALQKDRGLTRALHLPGGSSHTHCSARSLCPRPRLLIQRPTRTVPVPHPKPHIAVYARSQI